MKKNEIKENVPTNEFTLREDEQPIARTCIICGLAHPIPLIKTSFASRVCDDCRNAVQWVKDNSQHLLDMQKLQSQINAEQLRANNQIIASLSIGTKQ